jgi:hypothetical protein
MTTPISTRWMRFPAALTVSALVATGSVFAAAPALTPPEPAAVAEGRRLVEAMVANERGPYSRLRWFCDDGAVLPPAPYACRDHGGGHQYAEYSEQRHRLAELGWPAGTILTATPWDELWDGARRNRRLRELLVERYLVEVDDGWVLRRARFYRGYIQVEDEEQAGGELLVRLLAQPGWAAANFLLARESVRALPHGSGADRTESIRRLSQEIAERDPSFERIRVTIHTSPGPSDIDRTAGWIDAARRRGADPALIVAGETLLAELEKLYGSGDDWLEGVSGRMRRDPLWQQLETLFADLPSVSGIEACGRLASASALLREAVETSSDGARNLALMDLSIKVERQLLKASFAVLDHGQLARADLVALARRLLDGVYGSGLLSVGERAAVAGRLAAVESAGDASLEDYGEAVQGLRRVPNWCLATVRYTFAEALVGYGALEPEALRYVDDILRGSPMLPLATATTSLAGDADRLTGVTHRLFGTRYSGVLGLNPGIATGRLHVVHGDDVGPALELDPNEIVVLARTVSDLTPVAGILTLAEGNLLSHVQLLARNLGIPNAVVSPVLASALEAHDGREVVLGVGSDGSVVMAELTTLSESVLELVAPAGTARPAPAAKLEPPVPDLTIDRPITLAGLRSGMAGTVVGPKAANLGELASLFPGRVEQAVALPFGVFADHVAFGDGSPKAKLDRAYARNRTGTLDDAGLAAEIAAVYDAVAGIELQPAFVAELDRVMAQVFGPPGSYGVFVRSDTNVEDLPGFTGAGLNETIANVVDPAAQRRAIARVWASPYRERAVAWRAPLLTRPEEVYTSVLLMKSVPADKSGVLVTTDLVRRRPGLTVATSWGVGGAVDGDSAETVVLEPGGGAIVVGEAKAPYRRRLRETGGVEWVPAAAGAVLTASEQAALRGLAAEVAARLEPEVGADGRPLAWDIEFGFVAGKLELFQIRPLVERGGARADRALAVLAPRTEAIAVSVPLSGLVPVRDLPMEPDAR